MTITRHQGVALLSAVALLAGCGGPPEDPGDTAAPGTVPLTPSTAPEDVVRAYLGALQAGDDAVATSSTAEPFSGRDTWVTDTPDIEDVEVAQGEARSPAGTAAQDHAQAVHVPVTFDLRGADVSMPDGPTTWGYLLARDSDAEPWLIVDAGVA